MGIKNIFSFISKKIGLLSGSSLKQMGQRTFVVVNGQIISSPDNKDSYIKNGYAANDVVYSAANLIVDKVRVAPWGAYEVVDYAKLKKANALINKKDITSDDLREASMLKKSALVQSDEEKINKLIEYPNDYCTFSEFVAESSLHKLLTGDRYIFAEKLGEGANGDIPQSLWLLPPQHVVIVATTGFPVREEGYKLNVYGFYLVIPRESVLHDKFPNPDYSTSGSHLYGLSPLKAGLNLIDMIRESTTAAKAAFQNGGPKSIAFVDDNRFDPVTGAEQAQAIKKILQSGEYTGSDNYNKIAVSGYRMGVVPVGLSPVELGIIEAQKWGLRRVCNLMLGIPSQLLNDPDNKTYNNQKEGEKALTVRGALPLLTSFRDAFNKKLKSDWGFSKKNIYVDFDATVYSELQDEQSQKWAWVRELPISWRSKLDMMGIDADDENAALDEIMIPSGFEPIDSFNIVDDVIRETAFQNGNGKISENGKGNAGLFNRNSADA